MGTKPFEVIAHTADIAVDVFGRDLAELFVHAAQALYAVTFENVAIAAGQKRTLTLDSIDADALVVDWLNELIYLLEVEHAVFTECDVLELADGHATIECCGGRLDMSLSRRQREVKAATYHMTRLRRVPTGYTCRIVFDV